MKLIQIFFWQDDELSYCQMIYMYGTINPEIFAALKVGEIE
jgi:hypothetical protein